MRYVMWYAMALCVWMIGLCLPFVVAVDSVVVSPTPSPLPASPSPLPSAPSPATPATPPPQGPCKSGTSIGAFIVQFPNQSTVLIVGEETTIKWTFTPLVKNFPSRVTVLIHNMDSGDANAMESLVPDATISAQTRALTIRLRALNDGQYRIKLIGDGKDPRTASPPTPGSNNNTSSAVCVSDGDAVPGVSSPFKITNAVTIQPSGPDRYGPNIPAASTCILSSVSGLSPSIFTFIAVVTITM